MIFYRHSNRPIPTFAYRSEAFDYYFAKSIEDGKDEMKAAEEADKFANIVAQNKRLPDAPTPEMNTLEKGVFYANQIMAIKRDNPELWDLVTSIAGGLIGGVAGGATVNAIQAPPQEHIDFEHLE